jgi:Tfp pilus assembly protein PilX
MDRSLQDPQAGGITIIVTLMLLVLITVAAMGMSKNALRELAISGTSRQGSMARNVADSGIEWSVYWLDLTNTTSASGTALGLKNLKIKLGADPTLAGRAYDPTTQGLYNTSILSNPPIDTTIGSLSGTTQGFTVGLTRMGKLPITDMSQGVGQGTYAPAQGAVALQAPDLWALRSDSQITTGTTPFSTTFFHAKEAWVSTPAQ